MSPKKTTQHTELDDTNLKGPLMEREGYTSIPGIKQETFEQLITIMREERYASFNDMIALFIESWHEAEEAQKEADDSVRMLSNYFLNPQLLERGIHWEIFISLKTTYPAAYALAREVHAHQYGEESVQNFPLT